MSGNTARPVVAGDRTVSPAAGVSWWTTRRAATIGGCAIAALGAFVLWKMPAAQQDKNALPEKASLAFATQNPYKPPPADPQPEIQKAAAKVPADTGNQAGGLKDALTHSGGGGSSGGPPMFYSYAVPPLPEQFKPKANGTGEASGTGGGNAPETTAIAFKAAQIPGFKAGSMGDLALMLPPGVVICTMASVVESTVDGDFVCTIQRDVKSPAGVVLLDAGSYIQGTYDIHVQTGQRRLRAGAVTAWDLKTRCVVPLGGAMSDGMGRAGLDGDYDPHTWEKLGAAGIVMLTQNAFNLATTLLQSALQNGSNNRNSNNSSGNSYYQLQTGDMQSVASELLKSNANIPPTITVHQGSVVGFWIKQPVDFSSCYRLVSVE